MTKRVLIRRASALAVRHPRLLRDATWIGALVPVALVVSGVAVGAGPSSSCVVESPSDDGAIARASKGAVLKRDSEGFRIQFGDARDTRADIVVLPFELGRLESGDRAYPSMSDHLRSSKWTIRPARDVASGRSSPSWGSRITGSGVEVCLEIDASLVDVRPGRYAGSLGINGEDLEIGSTVPVEVTFRSSRLVAIGIAVAGVLLGLLVKMFTELAAANRSHADGVPRTVSEYLNDWGFRAAIILGAIMGWLAYVEVYGGNPTWGESETDWLKLFGTCFAFQLASVGGVDLARRLVTTPGSS